MANKCVRDKVAHQDKVNDSPEEQPGVVLNWGFIEGIVLGYLGL